MPRSPVGISPVTRAITLVLALVVLPGGIRAQGTVPMAPPPPYLPEPAAKAPARGATLGFALDLGIEFGGADFLEVAFTNGGTQKLRAGQGGTIAAGAIVRPSAASPLSLRGTVGIKYVTTAASNANITFIRVPVELVGSYAFPRGARIGAGVVLHAANRFRGDGFVPDETYRPAPGVTAEVGYKALALTYTALRYSSAGGPSFDGSSVGAQLLWTPRRRRR